MNDTIVKARRAMIKACVRDGIENPKDIAKVIRGIGKTCSPMQIAGVKAWVKHPNSFKRK